MLPTIDLQGDVIVMVDQRKLPAQEVYVRCRTAPEVAKAIRTMVIRGAPAIGVAAAYGLALGAKRSRARGPRWSRAARACSRTVTRARWPRPVTAPRSG